MRGGRSRKAALIGLLTGLLWVSLGVIYPSFSAAVGVSSLTGKINTPTSTLTLRSCASTTCSALRQVPHGTLLAMTAATGDWFKTSYGGIVGWVHSRYTVLQGTPATTISRGNTSRRMVSYTFDAGADLGYAGTILDFLRANNIKASFGITGKWASQPQLRAANGQRRPPHFQPHLDARLLHRLLHREGSDDPGATDRRAGHHQQQDHRTDRKKHAALLPPALWRLQQRGPPRHRREPLQQERHVEPGLTGLAGPGRNPDLQ